MPLIKTPYTFSKKERLCSKTQIENLFAQGASFVCFPIKIVWVETKINSEFPVQLAISVSRRNFKHAVKRNLIKRRLREAFRLHKSDLYQFLSQNNKQLVFMLIYIHNNIIQYAEIDIAMKKIIKKLTEKNSHK